MAASKQTLRNQRYQDKAGWVSKSYKLKKGTVETSADACNKAGVSQAGQITKMMKKFIEQVNETVFNYVPWRFFIISIPTFIRA